MENKIFIDNNVFLDLLLNRGDYGHMTSNFFDTCVDQKANLMTSVSCIQTMINVMQKSGCTAEVVRKSVQKINELIVLIETSRKDIDKACQSDFDDLEDAILYYTAISNSCSAFITRNVQNFPKTSERMKIIKPEEF